MDARGSSSSALRAALTQHQSHMEKNALQLPPIIHQGQLDGSGRQIRERDTDRPLPLEPYGANMDVFSSNSGGGGNGGGGGGGGGGVGGVSSQTQQVQQIPQHQQQYQTTTHSTLQQVEDKGFELLRRSLLDVAKGGSCLSSGNPFSTSPAYASPSNYSSNSTHSSAQTYCCAPAYQSTTAFSSAPTYTPTPAPNAGATPMSGPSSSSSTHYYFPTQSEGHTHHPHSQTSLPELNSGHAIRQDMDTQQHSHHHHHHQQQHQNHQNHHHNHHNHHHHNHHTHHPPLDTSVFSILGTESSQSQSDAMLSRALATMPPMRHSPNNSPPAPAPPPPLAIHNMVQQRPYPPILPWTEGVGVEGQGSGINIMNGNGNNNGIGGIGGNGGSGAMEAMIRAPRLGSSSPAQVQRGRKRKVAQAKTQLKKQKVRRKWTDRETMDLFRGCEIHGVGNWKKVLDDPRFSFDNRSSVDLKDRFRTCFPGDSFNRIREGKLDVSGATAKVSDISNILDAGESDAEVKSEQSPLKGKVKPFRGRSSDTPATDVAERLGFDSNFPKASRRARNPFTKAEDEALLRGFQMYGALWSKIQADKDLDLAHRRSTDLRDRFRNAYPDRYTKAGFKARPKNPPKPPRSGPSKYSEEPGERALADEERQHSIASVDTQNEYDNPTDVSGLEDFNLGSSSQLGDPCDESRKDEFNVSMMQDFLATSSVSDWSHNDAIGDSINDGGNSLFPTQNAEEGNGNGGNTSPGPAGAIVSSNAMSVEATLAEELTSGAGALSQFSQQSQQSHSNVFPSPERGAGVGVGDGKQAQAQSPVRWEDMATHPIFTLDTPPAQAPPLHQGLGMDGGADGLGPQLAPLHSPLLGSGNSVNPSSASSSSGGGGSHLMAITATDGGGGGGGEMIASVPGLAALLEEAGVAALGMGMSGGGDGRGQTGVNGAGSGGGGGGDGQQGQPGQLGESLRRRTAPTLEDMLGPPMPLDHIQGYGNHHQQQQPQPQQQQQQQQGGYYSLQNSQGQGQHQQPQQQQQHYQLETRPSPSEIAAAPSSPVLSRVQLGEGRRGSGGGGGGGDGVPHL